ncbi:MULTISPECIES: DUF4326 domain-containing protein [Vibrio harveyi group]|uniref:DUF4326 domain-containing protein n=1 Tax=Vibrio harveyi group TaxID=717610 RepID=UPI00111FD0B4|nr:MULTISPECIES: DUF4326 domain-containing protein [Vibrio harveyi group]EHD0099896.1 DUF4326 domain-containing protein [Vibrio vulnificus]EGR1597561.1 DUF4326 domain-containing protein [Vibrio parahaemolyticus]EGR1758419.1 DUF4326 domain-containing protein [Vibrio parahaemolyticus]ELP7003161.1 DUF4326 domain-containing protein [Vibrio vulnificus]MBE4296605.1 DUF4326 domain-containing protein [Vibrio parahaemolyticus]
MAKILILYPQLFNCYSKFARKVGKITSSLDDVELIYPHDPNQLIEVFCAENAGIASSNHLSNWSCDDITHAIVFDDGEEFVSEVELLKTAQIPLRFIRIKITRVINIKTETKYQAETNSPHYEYIGRRSYWGNPYSMFEDGDRDEVIRKFKYDFDYDKFLNVDKSKVYSLAGKRLGCFCKPQACHGDVLADFLNSWDDGK